MGCNFETGELYETYKSLKPFNDPELIGIAQNYTHGAICGTKRLKKSHKSHQDYVKDAAKLVFTNLNGENDGDVELNACQKVAKKEKKWHPWSAAHFWQAPYQHSEISGQRNIDEVIQW